MTPAVLLPLLLVVQAPVQLQLSSISNGDVTVARDGYVLVLGTNDRGLATVVHPRRPADDSHVTAGSVIKVSSQRAETWVAVWSDRPFDTHRFTANTFWSGDSLRRAADGSSAEALVAIARRMAGGGSIAYSVASAERPPLVISKQVQPRIYIEGRHYDPRYLGIQEQIVRQGKFSGAPPAVCTATVCAQSVWEQLGSQGIRDPFQRP